jgi:coenzyme PQQ precursor peptide PqqA
MPRRPTRIINGETLATTELVDRRGFELTWLLHRLTLAWTETSAKEMAMKWKTPVIIEIAVGLEINAYACAEVK